jgi:hypothetical protein
MIQATTVPWCWFVKFCIPWCCLFIFTHPTSFNITSVSQVPPPCTISGEFYKGFLMQSRSTETACNMQMSNWLFPGSHGKKQNQYEGQGPVLHQGYLWPLPIHPLLLTCIFNTGRSSSWSVSLRNSIPFYFQQSNQQGIKSCCEITATRRMYVPFVSNRTEQSNLQEFQTGRRKSLVPAESIRRGRAQM